VTNATANGSTLVKSGGTPGLDDAGAVSAQELEAGDGWLEVTVAETQTFRFVGLAHPHSGTSASDIDFAFRLQAGRADLYERGAYRADNTVAVGDRLRVAVESGVVRFYENDALVYTSATAPSYPLVAAAALIDAGAGIASARLDTGAPTTPPPLAGSANHHRFCGWLMATGWVPIAQDPNYADFVAHADQFDAVHPTWYHLASTTTLAPSYGEGAAAILANTTVGGKRTLLIPTIAAADGNEPGWASTMLHDATLRAQHEAAIVQLVTSKSYDGIDLDYEHLPDADRDAFSTFAAELGQMLHAGGKTLSFAVGALSTSRYSHWDYTALAAVADELHVMGYDFHYLGSHPGPVAPLGWIQQVLAYIGTIANGQAKGKFILGVPNYGIAGADSSTTTWFGSAMDCISAAGGSYDVTTTHMSSCPLTNGVAIAPGRAPNAPTANGHVFFDDIASMEEKVAAAQIAGLGGATYWTIGGEPDRPGPRTFFEMMRSHFPK
jgi:spore germination protein YaaH